mmetsp:Transcript_32165/g.44087  ORF Transcript_32165/g.44087 Transcript_32165/m.44087 type:complete len:416 (+) Transcript_32165:22-1269(+)|eukprot:CAMPEP_0201485982 /NCGR_PEP_ID=MMETSP0151_2-20130828/10040_1 /ASSEMBLY_ACC=CAM_ASM_000257 /TAXON_ID=200890 /ORGANISM="Paramoeba atlantica, Strain 621/1 / CCAP 1560/9" /LENGTH=415 /DNA_ID=CAMNT_0047870343 /DNA_START=22 /DNA_END=1269 /DNA_ORIENTATION=-
MGWTVVREGQRVAVWSVGGRCEFVDGPRLLFTVLKTVQRLPSYFANQYQYLEVRSLDGHMENLPGPRMMFLNPLEHSSIVVKDAIHLAAHEVLVVYRREYEGKEYDGMMLKDPGPEMLSDEGVTRMIVRGPKVHFPSNFEWHHKFEWHGESAERKAHIVPKAQKFQILKMIPTSFYYNVTDVRTADDALVSVKVMIFYEIEDLEKMLDTTDDPIADIVNASCSDIVSFVSSIDYISFVENVSRLSDLETYAKLTSRASSIGVNVTRIVYRGYHASENLQIMHNQAIEKRTQMRLEGESEATTQEIESLKLRGMAERSQAKMQMEEESKRHENTLINVDHAEKLRRERLENEEILRALREENDEKLRLYAALTAAGVDLTKYLTAPYNIADRTIRIEGGESNSNLHIHEETSRRKK